MRTLVERTDRPQPDGIPAEVAEELASLRRRLDVAVEATGLGFWEWNLKTDTLTWSERNRALFGLGPKAKVTVERYMALVHPDDRDSVREAFLSARERPGGGDFSIEYRAVADDVMAFTLP